MEDIEMKKRGRPKNGYSRSYTLAVLAKTDIAECDAYYGCRDFFYIPRI